MTLALEVNDEAYAKLTPELQPLYVKNGDGTYHLDLDKDAVETRYAKPLRNALDGERTEKRALKKDLDAERQWLKDLGIDDKDEIKAALETQRKAHEKKLIDEGEFEALAVQRVEKETKRMRDAHTKEVTELTTQTETLNSRLTELLLDNPVLAGCTKFGVREKAVGDVLERARKVFYVNKDGGFGPRSLPDGTQPRGKDGNPLGLEEWFADLAVAADHLFQPNSGSGASNPQGGGAPPAAAGLTRSKMSDEQKSKFIQEHGGDAYLKLPA